MNKLPRISDRAQEQSIANVTVNSVTGSTLCGADSYTMVYFSLLRFLTLGNL
jgi:hypothetical protein